MKQTFPQIAKNGHFSDQNFRKWFLCPFFELKNRGSRIRDFDNWSFPGFRGAICFYEKSSLLFFPGCRSIQCCMKLNASNPASTRKVAAMDMAYMPPPHASPMAAVTQMPAAVVSPLSTLSLLRKMMVPAPMKHIPNVFLFRLLKRNQLRFPFSIMS